MAHIYRAADVLLATSVGEGFGVPILEAQACGTPVIIGNWTAMEDLLFDGISLSKDDAFHYFDQQGAHIFLPHPDAITRAILAMTERSQQTHFREAAIRGTQSFSIAAVAQHWRETLVTMEEMILRDATPIIHKIVAPL